MKYRILIVDDEPDVRAIIAATLRLHYEVVEAHDGLDALEKLERAEPDFVLMDVMMPLMDGFQACNAIRKNPRFCNLPVMFLSALGAAEDIRKGYAVGANLYLTKPFEPARLLRNIQVFFETTPPSAARKRYTIEQLEALEKSDPIPPPDIHGAETHHDFMLDLSSSHAAPSAPPPKARPAPVPPSPPAPLSAAPPPPAEPVEAPAAEEAFYEQTIPQRPRVLVVDDDPEVIDLMTVTLGDLYEVTFANDGLQAIERVVRHQPDIIIVDIMLPKMSGFQLCQSLRANKSFARTPILICSAKSGERDITYARRCGANDYLVKPFSPTQLLEFVGKIVRQPGFAIRPKTLPFADVLAEIRPTPPDEESFLADSDVRKAEAPATGSGEEGTQDAIRRFLRREGAREAFSSEEDEKKKGRRGFFGFRRKK